MSESPETKVVLLEVRGEERDQNHKGPVQWDAEPHRMFQLY